MHGLDGTGACTTACPATRRAASCASSCCSRRTAASQSVLPLVCLPQAAASSLSTSRPTGRTPSTAMASRSSSRPCRSASGPSLPSSPASSSSAYVSFQRCVSGLACGDGGLLLHAPLLWLQFHSQYKSKGQASFQDVKSGAARCTSARVCASVSLPPLTHWLALCVVISCCERRCDCGPDGCVQGGCRRCCSLSRAALAGEPSSQPVKAHRFQPFRRVASVV